MIKGNMYSGVRKAVAMKPFFLSMSRLVSDRRRAQVCSSNTQMVVEGFPRSGNTYLYRYLTFRNPELLNVAHHIHAPAQFALAKKYGIPAVWVVRAPAESILSYCVYFDVDRLVDVANSYYDYFDYVMKLRYDGLMVVDFMSLIEDPSLVLLKISERWKELALNKNPNNGDGAEVAKIMRERNIKVNGGAECNDPLPNEEKEVRKASLQSKLVADGFVAAALEKCNDVYARAVSA